MSITYPTTLPEPHPEPQVGDSEHCRKNAVSLSCLNETRNLADQQSKAIEELAGQPLELPNGTATGGPESRSTQLTTQILASQVMNPSLTVRSADAKRSLSNTCRSISPPALRRKVSHTAEDEVHVANTWSASPDRVRIFSWNVNGVGPLLQKHLSFSPGSLSPLRSFLKCHQWPQLLCLQEVKVGSKDVATQRQVHQAANHGYATGEPTYTVHFSLPRDKYNATGFGGKVHGVASVIRDDFASGLRVTQRPEWDLEGRVLIHEHELGLVIINGYWVNGTFNPYRDPVTGQMSGTRHDHKLRFHQHMLADVLQHETEGRHVVLIGDMNIARSRIDGHPNLRTSPLQHVKNRADFNSKFFTDVNGMRGIDVFRHLHGNTKKFTYYPRGGTWGASCDRVDLIIVSHALVDDLDVVTGTDILDSASERGHSDHVPLWISLDLAKLPEKKPTS